MRAPGSGQPLWCGGLARRGTGGAVLLPGAEGRSLYAIDNHDPQSGANVIGRGLVGNIKGEMVVASPIYKQHFRLEDGSCLEYPQQRLRVWPVRLNGSVVEVAVV